jgi:hypothetical protein
MNRRPRAAVGRTAGFLRIAREVTVLVVNHTYIDRYFPASQRLLSHRDGDR